MDVIWDTHGKITRAWLYGPSWVYTMIPGIEAHSEDDGDSVDAAGIKRLKLDGGSARNSGAGDAGRLWKINNDITDTSDEHQESPKKRRRRSSGIEDSMALVVTGKGGNPDGQLGWITHKYRHILGIIPMGSGSPPKHSDEHDAVVRLRNPSFEVALVERPPWDLDLPARHYDSHEWTK
jgi:hypothetical protein